MKFGLSMDALSAAGDEAWRLQADRQHWQPCSFATDLRPGDAVLESPDEAVSLAGQRLKKDKALGLKPAGRPGLFDFLMRGIFAHPVVHRFSPAPIPDKAQMIATLAGLKPNTAWLLYLDLGGNFRALDSAATHIIGNLDIAVRGEIASSPGYVGTEAATDMRLMDDIYLQFLAGWLTHLKSRRLGVFVPDVEKLQDETTLRQAIASWPHE
jgi:hypothetical protein